MLIYTNSKYYFLIINYFQSDCFNIDYYYLLAKR